MKLVIDRSKWRNGGEPKSDKFGETYLLNSKGYMCCLGFLGLACGHNEEDIRREFNPRDVVNSKYPGINNINTSIRYDELIEINDNPRLHSFEREKKLKEKFKELNVDVEFVGEYPK